MQCLVDHAHLLFPSQEILQTFSQWSTKRTWALFRTGWYFYPYPTRYGWPSLLPLSYARISISVPYGFAFRTTSEEVRGFRVPCIRRNRRVRSALSTGWASSVSGELAAPELASVPFWPELISLLSSLPRDDGCEHSRMLTVPSDPSPISAETAKRERCSRFALHLVVHHPKWEMVEMSIHCATGFTPLWLHHIRMPS